MAAVGDSRLIAILGGSLCVDHLVPDQKNIGKGEVLKQRCVKIPCHPFSRPPKEFQKERLSFI